MTSSLYAELAAFDDRPAPFSKMTIATLWTDPHIARQMLAFHLDPAHDAASRRPESIDGFVGWLDQRLPVAGRKVMDLGCGPGLYALRLAQRGAQVTGIDFSKNSIAYARDTAAAAGLAIDYRIANYLEDELPGGQDLVIMIYGDYCAMAPDQRARLLQRVRATLAPGGCFVFDVFSPGQMHDLSEGFESGRRFMQGFWAEGDYFGFKRTFLWPEELVSLERYLVATPDRQFEVLNWMQYYTPQSIAAELAKSGFAAEAAVEFVTGEPWQDGAMPIAIVAQPHPAPLS